NAQPLLPSLLFAGIILEGGIIGYDSNTVTGGIGARYLGIGGDAQYRQDTVTVYLNAISSQNGEILKSVMARKTVASYGVRGSVFKFVAFQKLLEGETGYTVNEPGQIAVAQAIEHAVRALIIEGALEGLWQFEDQIAGRDETQLYLADKEADLLLGDAGTAVAQALLTEGQLKTLADAREARRERLKAQSERRQQRQLAALNESSQQKLPPPPPLKTSALPEAFDPKIEAESSAEKLVDSLKRQDNSILQQMVKTVTGPKLLGNTKRQTEEKVSATAISASKIDALYKVLAEFKAETWLLLRLDDTYQKNMQSVKPVSGNHVVETTLTDRSLVQRSKPVGLGERVL
ncbi:MAG: CsgG/HfaB family protein, partial [Cyanobacteria bacterium P01_F01_bin.33]